MKYLKNFEAVYPKQYNHIDLDLDSIHSKCELFINDLKKCEKGSFLYRGSVTPSEDYKYDIKLFDHDMFQRYSKDIPSIVHQDLNDVFLREFGWNVRNGVFSFGSKGMSEGYGTPYLLFPIDNYKIVWSDSIHDLFLYMDDKGMFEDERWDDNEEIYYFPKVDYSLVFKYQDGNLCKAIKSENEICVACEQYYLVNIKHIPELTKQIWG